MASSPLSLVQTYNPTTFLERGAMVPFTTPLLTGARARPGERGSIELVVPNPSGGRGVYILPWANLRALCQPTVHDRRLFRKAATLNGISPSGIRDIARHVAAEGLAGAAARQAALTAMETDRHDRLTTHLLLLLRLIKQLIPGTTASLDVPRVPAAELEKLARQVVRLIADHLRRPADAVAANLEALTGAFAAIGMPGQTEPCRVQRLLRTLRGVHDEVADWSDQLSEGDNRAGARMLVAAAELTLTCTETLLAEALALTADTVTLLRDWNAAPDKVARLAARPDWLLDGWEAICALWEDASCPADRLAALPEMAQLVPVLPQETAAWVGVAVDPAKLAAFRRRVLLNEDWRTGSAVHSLTARNERLRALAP